MTTNDRAEDTMHRIDGLRLTLEDALQQAQRVIEMTHRIETSETMRYVAGLESLKRTDSAVSESTALIR